MTAELDCADDDPLVRPGVVERCDFTDENCTGGVDDEAGHALWLPVEGEPIDLTATLGSTSVVDWEAPGAGTLNLCAQTWNVRLVIGHDVTIQGAGADVTRIDAQGDGLVVFVTDGESILRDLTISGGATSDFGGCVLAESDTTLERVVIEDCSASRGGGLLSTAPVVIRDSVLRNNTASQGGAITNLRGEALVLDHVEIADNMGAGSAGGLELSGDVTITGCDIHGNSASIGGAMTYSGSRLDLIDTRIYDNAAGNRGGALNISSDSEVFCSGTLDVFSGFHNNSAQGAGGGAISMDFDQSIFTAVDCDFGAGDEDNGPDDLSVNGTSVAGLGDDVSFTCRGLTGACE